MYKLDYANRMFELGIARDSKSTVFGQLLGMCDHVTFSLGNNNLNYTVIILMIFLKNHFVGSSGYLAYKYMPYGPIEEALPYLQRRANENKGMLRGAVRERTLLAKELKRRFFIPF